LVVENTEAAAVEEQNLDRVTSLSEKDEERAPL
jgi:hypothetical protein